MTIEEEKRKKPLGLGKRKAETLPNPVDDNDKTSSGQYDDEIPPYADIYIPNKENGPLEDGEEWNSVMAMYRHAQHLMMVAYGDIELEVVQGSSSSTSSPLPLSSSKDNEEQAQALFRAVVHECDRLAKQQDLLEGNIDTQLLITNQASFFNVFGGSLLWLSVTETKSSVANSERKGVDLDYVDAAWERIEMGKDIVPSDSSSNPVVGEDELELKFIGAIAKYLIEGTDLNLEALMKLLEVTKLDQMLVITWVRFLLLAYDSGDNYENDAEDKVGGDGDEEEEKAEKETERNDDDTEKDADKDDTNDNAIDKPAFTRQIFNEKDNEMVYKLALGILHHCQALKNAHPLLRWSWKAKICEIVGDKENWNQLERWALDLWNDLECNEWNQLRGTIAQKNGLILKARCCLYQGSIAEQQANDDDDDDTSNDNQPSLPETALKWYKQAQTVWHQLVQQFNMAMPEYIASLLD